jgi:thymidylate kinase
MNTDNLDAIQSKIKKILLEQNLISKEKSSLFFIKSSDFNLVLKIIFNILSDDDYSFSINRENLNNPTIIIFDKSSNNHIKMDFEFIDNKDPQISKLSSLEYKLLQKTDIIPLIGPDGVGKTTLVKSIIKHIDKKTSLERFKKIVRRSLIYNLIHPINKNILKSKLGKKPQKDQHDDKYPKLIILAGVFYYPILMLTSFLQKKIIFVDRFFQDALLEDISFMEKETHLRDNYKKLLKMIPRTYLHVQLDAKSELILERKDELSSDDIDKYRELNFLVYLEKPSIIYLYINTANDIQNCTQSFLNTYNSMRKDI